MKQLRRITTALIAAGLLLASATVSARDYDLELIVFERFKPIAGSTEVWSAQSGSQKTYQSELLKLNQRASPLPALGGVSRLSSVQDALQKSGYRVLGAARWRQPSAFYNNAPVYRITSDDGRLDGVLRIYKTTLIFADLLLSLKSQGLPDLPLPSPSSIETDLQTQFTQQTELQPTEFFISEKRNMRFKEVHYFDHPKYGAVLTVWPTE